MTESLANLPQHAEVIVVGGGIMGCSTAYHLARDHKADVVLLEQNRLTSGATWHAAGLVGQLRASAGVTQLLRHSVTLYERLAGETGLETGWNMSGCLRLACHQDRWIEFKRLATTAKSFGFDMELLSPADVKAMWPLMYVDDLVGATFIATDGQANPSDITQSLARGARLHGARLIEGVRVVDFELDGARVGAVATSHGRISCEHVVVCAGVWSRQLAALAGVNIPIQPVKHQYLITEPLPGLPDTTPTVRDPDRRTYFKEEVGGLVMGGYETNPKAWVADDVPADFGFQLFDDDWDHFEQHMLAAIARVPALGEIGVKQLINGAESFTPDGNFILGPAHQCRNLYAGAGFNSFGIAAGGGAGWALAEWIMTGEAPLDLWTVDIHRFADLHRDRDWVKARTLEAYGKHYGIGYPFDEYVSGRPKLLSPLYSRLQRYGAVFGSKLGWERPNWFAGDGATAADQPSMGRANWFSAVAHEHEQVREKVGLFDQSSFAKFEITGPDAMAALDRLCANDVRKPPGRLTYTQLLNNKGGIECDLTVARLAEDHFYLVTGTGFRSHDFAWIDTHLDGGYDCRFRDVTEAYATLTLAGPLAREVLQKVTHDVVSGDQFAYGAVRVIGIAGHRVRAARISYVGELGWELHMLADAAGDVFDALMAAGEVHGITPAGYRAIESLRLEKAYRAWGADITPNDLPDEAGLGWAVKVDRDVDFIGREAVTAARRRPLRKRLAIFTVEDQDTVLLGRETILRNQEPVGYLTSGGYGYTVARPIGLGYINAIDDRGIDNDYINAGTYALVVANETVPATVHLQALYDPRGHRMRDRTLEETTP